MKLVTVVGARPQFIKAATVSRAIEEHNAAVEEDEMLIAEVIVHTGQHYDYSMSDVFFDQLGIPEPDYELGVGSGGHGRQTGRIMERLEQVLLEERPDWALVYGDTNSTLAGALAAVKLHIPVAHVEAGLRSFNRKMPEEINRLLTDHVSDCLFAPTEVAVKNLIREGISEQRIRLVGDVMYDAAIYYKTLAEKKSSILEKLDLKENSYILATVHRAENTDDETRLRAIFNGLRRVACEVPVVMPLHPRTRRALGEIGWLGGLSRSLRLIGPVGYFDMVMLEQYARLIVTDSGGVQKEAFFFSVPCVTLRDETEWVELLELGWNYLVPPSSAESVAETVLRAAEKGPGVDALPYGDGRSAHKIVSTLVARGR